jgi:hypothetical protein
MARLCFVSTSSASHQPRHLGRCGRGVVFLPPDTAPGLSKENGRDYACEKDEGLGVCVRYGVCAWFFGRWNAPASASFLTQRDHFSLGISHSTAAFLGRFSKGSVAMGEAKTHRRGAMGMADVYVLFNYRCPPPAVQASFVSPVLFQSKPVPACFSSLRFNSAACRVAHSAIVPLFTFSPPSTRALLGLHGIEWDSHEAGAEISSQPCQQ